MSESTCLKAYAVTEIEEGIGGIHFARSNYEARKIGARLYADGDRDGVRVRRAPEFDAYTPGPVPKLAMLDHGWRFECHGCECLIHADTQEDFNDEAAEGETPRNFAPVEYGDAIYCSESCRQSYLAKGAAQKAAEAVVIEEMTARLLALVPGVTPTTSHAYVVRDADSWVANLVVIGFRFPGAQYGDAHYRFDKAGEDPHITICHGDQGAWSAWRLSLVKES